MICERLKHLSSVAIDGVGHMRKILSLCLLSVFASTMASYAQMIPAVEAKDDMQERNDTFLLITLKQGNDF